MDFKISIAGSLIRTYPEDNTNPRKRKIIIIEILDGALFSKGTVTGLIVVNTGVSLFTCNLACST